MCKMAALISGIISLHFGRKWRRVVHIYIGQWFNLVQLFAATQSNIIRQDAALADHMHTFLADYFVTYSRCCISTVYLTVTTVAAVL